MGIVRTDYERRLRFQLDNLKAIYGDRNVEWTYDEFASYLLEDRGLRESTIANHVRALRRMSAHPIVPVRVVDRPVDELVTSFRHYCRQRRDGDLKKPTALKGDHEAIRALGAFLGIPPNVWPAQPHIPKKAGKRLPSPEQVYELLHAEYVVDAHHNYEQALIRYLLVLDFGFGIRFPSEAHALKLQDFDPKEHTLIVTEPKKGFPTRRLLIEPEWLCCSPRHASLAQYLHWRKKVDVGGTDAFFLQKSGEPFGSEKSLNKWFKKKVKQHYPWFHSYLGRTWCANARLIEWDYDYVRVANWLGHENVEKLRHAYEQDIRYHAKIYGKHWLSRAFKAQPPEQPTNEPPGTPTPYSGPRLAFSGAFPPVEVDAGVRI